MCARRIDHDVPMTTATNGSQGRAAVVALEVVALVVAVVLGARLVRLGYGDQIDALTEPAVWPLVVAILPGGGRCGGRRKAASPVGWLFIGLSLSLLASGLLDEWFTHAAIVSRQTSAGRGSRRSLPTSRSSRGGRCSPRSCC